jgi:GNAT superfamily N-acetyltransferase
MTIIRIDDSFGRWSELLELILAAFAYMDGRIDPPSSALGLTQEALKRKAQDEIGYAALDGEVLKGCMFLRPEVNSLYLGKLAIAPEAQRKGTGRALLQIAEAVAGGLRLGTIRLDTRIELIDNHAVFGAWGFVKTAEKSHPGFDRVTYIEMRKMIPA